MSQGEFIFAFYRDSRNLTIPGCQLREPHAEKEQRWRVAITQIDLMDKRDKEIRSIGNPMSDFQLL